MTLSGTGCLRLRPFGVRLIAAVTPAGLPGQAGWQVYLSKRDAAALFAAQAGETAAESSAAVYRPKHGSVVLLSMLTSNSLMGFLMLAGLIRETGALAGDTLRRVAAVEFRQGVLVRPGGRCDLLVTVMGRAGDRIRVRGVEKSAAWALLKEAGVLTAEEA